ncbi:Uncharacterised protein [Vibrio cholerae]|nr:Uncharacterised protein [Vibrio cholerae]CSI79633.1 Uncharacterised protein [Vibrio cholerae]
MPDPYSQNHHRAYLGGHVKNRHCEYAESGQTTHRHCHDTEPECSLQSLCYPAAESNLFRSAQTDD